MLNVFVRVCKCMQEWDDRKKSLQHSTSAFMRKRKKQKSTTHPCSVSSTKRNGFDVFDSVLVSCLAFFIPYSTCESETAMSHALKVCRISIATAI